MTASAIKGTTKAAATRQPIRIHTQVDTPVRVRVTSVSGETVVVIAFWVVLAVVVVGTVVVTLVVVVATVVVATVVVTGGETWNTCTMFDVLE